MFAGVAAHHCFVLDVDGQPWAFGCGGSGQLGLLPAGDKLIPQRVPWTGPPIVTIACGEHHSALVDAEGGLWITGGFIVFSDKPNRTYNELRTFTRVPSIPPMASVAAGREHIVALDHNGKLWTIGSPNGNSHGQMGLGHTNAPPKSPTEISGLPSIIRVACGEQFTFAEDDSSNIWVWGDNSHTPFGLKGLGAAILTPTVIPSFGLQGPTRSMAASSYSLVILDSDGFVWVSQAAGGFEIKTGLDSVVSVAAGSEHFLAIEANGTAMGWGQNGGRELGMEYCRRTEKPLKLPMGPAMVVAAGKRCSYVQVVDGSVMVTGGNYRGQLGLGDTSARWGFSPLALQPAFSGKRAKSARSATWSGN